MPHPTYFIPWNDLGGPHNWSQKVQKILPLPGFDPWTVQPVASHYTDCANLALFILYTVCQNLLVIFDEIQYCENIKSCNNTKPHTHHEKTHDILLEAFIQYVFPSLSCTCPMDSLKLLIFATAYPNTHFLPNINMLLQLKRAVGSTRTYTTPFRNLQ